MKTEKLSIFISIVLISLLALGAVSAADDTAATDDAPEAIIEEVQTIDNTITNDDMSYESSDIIVNTTGDSGDLDKDSKANLASTKLSEGETSSFTNLADNINNAPSYLSLSGNYAYDSTIDGDYVTGIYINKDITINGGGTTTIDGRNVARIFNISNGHNVVLRDITFTNGNIEQGGAIYNDGNLILKDCKFASNAAQYGGAIYNTENGVITGDSNFTSNVAVYRGGAIYSEGSVALSDSVIDGNDITYRAKNDDNGGAAIYNNGGTLTLDKVQVTNNLLDIVIRDGNDGHLINAAIFTSGDATITDSVISNNSGSWGGGIYVTNGATLDVSGTTFEKNMATFGAAIYDEGAKVIVNNCDFNENHCEGIGSAGTSSTQAAAILVMSKGASATITDSRFNKNSAKTGGAVSISKASGDVLIEGCTFTENSASYEGGAIYNYAADGAELTVKDSTFTDNTAANWGDAISNDAGLKLEGNTITGDVNTAIGNWLGTIDTQVKVKILDGQEHTVTNPTIDLTATVTDDNGNKINDHAFTFTVGAEEVPATYDATEGIYKATYTFKNPGTYTISTDSYTLDDVTDSVITFKSSLSSLKSLIDENTNGTLDLTYGFLYDDELDSAIKISGIAINKDITINGNGVTLSGADVARLFEINSGFTLTLNNLIISNFVSNYGPAAYVHNGATLNSNNVNYNNNIANANGGAIYSEYGNLVIIGSTFTNNEAKGTYGTSTGVGSAIYDFAGINPGTTTYITDSTFTNNAGTGTKAGVYVDNAVITGSTFTNTVIFAMRKASISNDVFDNEGNDIHLSTNTGFVFYDGTGDLPVLSKATINYTGTSFQGLQDIITNSDYGTKTLNIGLHNDITKLADEEFANGIVIDKKVLINGLGNTVDVNGQGKAFYISEGADVSLRNMEIVGDGTSPIVNDGLIKDYNPNMPITFINAGEYPIDNDEGIISINYNTKTFTQLNSVISMISGGTISSAANIVTKGDDEKETFADGITITQKDLSIISSLETYQRTIDADNFGRIFNVADGASLTLKNITLQNGNAADGGAVYVNDGGKLVADSTKFLNNKATYSGGAIYATGATVSLDNCILDNNDATDHSTNNDTGGAAIYAEDSTVTISKTKVTNNGDKTLNRTKGDLINGVLNLHDSTTTITDSVFENNTGIYGGAITAETTKDEGVSKLTISGTNFTSNAAYTGGAVYVADTEFDISDSIFDANNKASGEGSTGYTAGGGALVIMSGSEGSLDNVTVKNSHASQGGAIDLENSQVTITGSKFESNSADGWAGAIYATGNSALTVEDSSFKENTAAAATIVTFGATTATIKDSNFTDNYDTYSWGVVTVYGTGDVNIEGSKFTKDVDGTYTVDVYVVDDAKVSVKDSTFDTNSYYSIVAEDGKLTLEGNDIKSDYVPIYTVADAEIVSKVKAVISENETYYIESGEIAINATLTDDMGNMIRDANFNFVVYKGDEIAFELPATFDGQKYTATFAPTVADVYLVTLDYPVEEVQTATYYFGSVVVIDFPIPDIELGNEGFGWLNVFVYDPEAEDQYDGEQVETTANLIFKDAEGNVVLTMEGVETSTSRDTAVEFNSSKFAIGKYTVTVVLGDNFVLADDKDTFEFEVTPIFLDAKVEGSEDISYGDKDTHTITLGKYDYELEEPEFIQYDYTGTAIVKVYDYDDLVKEIEVAIVDGEGTISFENIPAGLYFYEITLDDETYAISRDEDGDSYLYELAIAHKKGTYTDLKVQIEDAIAQAELDGEEIVYIELPYNFAYDAEYDGEAFLDGIEISDSIVIDGNNMIISGEEQASIFTVAEGAVLTISDAFLAEGNGINGGAVYVSEGSIFNANNVNFVGNKASNGGAIYSEGTTTIVNSFFNKNDPEYGGAIYVAAGETLVKDNTAFIENNADFGGAIYVDSGASLTVEDSTFSENTASGGSAIYADYGSELTISGSEFTENIASGNYGAVYIAADEATVSDSTFAKNTGGNGGAIFWTGDDGELTDSEFTENTATGSYSGGAVFVFGDGVEIDGCTFEENVAANAGGAVSVFNQGTTGGHEVTINDCDFISNNAASGGAVYWTGESGTLSDSLFKENEATTNGAAILATGTGFSVINSVFIENSAATDGAIYLVGNDATIKEDKFIRSAATMGAIVLDGATITVSDSLFSTNAGMPVHYNILNSGTITSIKDTTFETIVPTIEAEDSYVYGDTIEITGKFDWGVQKPAITMKYTINGVEGTTTVLNGEYKILIDNQPDVGDYTIVISSFVDNNGNFYEVNTAQATFSVVKATPILEVEGDDYLMPHDTATVGITLTGALEEGIEGIVIVTVDGKDYVVYTDENGEAELEIPDLAAAEYPITAKFIGNDKYNEVVNDTEVIDFMMHAVEFDIVIENIIYGEDLVVIVDNVTDADGNPLTGTVMGNIINEDGAGAGLIVYVEDGYGTRTIKGLDADTYEVTATFYDDDYEYISETVTFNITVDKAAAVVDASADHFVYGTNGTLEITVTDVNDNVINGTAFIEIDGEIYALDIDVEDGKATVNLTNFDVGSYVAEVSFTAGNYRDVSYITHFNVTKATPTISIEDAEAVWGEVATIKFNVTGVDGAKLNGEAVVTVSWDVDGVSQLVTVTDGEGQATFKIDGLVAPGTYDVTVKFIGDRNYADATQDGAKLTLTGPKEVNIDVEVEAGDYGEVTNVTVTVTDKAGEPLANAKVNFSVDDGEFVEYTLGENGSIIIPVVDADAGTHTITVKFDDEDHDAAEATKEFTVDPASGVDISFTAVDVEYGNDYPIKITAVDANDNPVNGSAFLVLDGNQLIEVEIVDGEAQYNIPGLDVGSYYLEVIFNNGNYLPTTWGNKINVTKATPTVKVEDAEADWAEPANIDVTVTDSEGMPINGTAVVRVSWNVDGVDHYIDIEDGTGKATFALKDLVAPGVYDVTVFFEGGRNYNDATATAKLTLTSPKEVTLDVEVEDCLYGESTSATITVTDVGGAPVANAKVNVSIDDGEFAEYTLNENGTVTVPVEVTKVGEHNVTVKFDDGVHNPAQGTADFVVYKDIGDFDYSVAAVDYRDKLVVVITDVVDSEGNPLSGVATVYYNDGEERSATGEIVNGAGEVELTELDAGSYELLITIENENYDFETAFAVGVVNKALPEISVNVETVEYGSIANVEIEIRGYHEETIDTTLTVLIDDVEIGEYTTVDGKVTLPVDTQPDVGTYIIDVDFAGDDNYYPATNSAKLVVTKATPVITVEGAEVEWGNPATIKVTVSDSEGMPVEGTAVVRVSWIVDGVDQYIDITEGSGEATFEISGLVAPGEYDVKVMFLGGRNYNDVNNTDAKLVLTTPAAVNLNVNADAGEFGEDTNITVTLTDTAYNPMEGSVVTVYVDDKELTKATIGEDGTVTVPISDLTAGEHTVKVVLDDGVHDLAEKEISFTVDPTSGANIKFTGEDVEFGNDYPIKITVVDPEDNPLDGKAIVVLDGNAIAEVNIVAGAGEYNITGLDVGSYYLEVIFNNDNYLPTNYGDKINVTRATPTVKVEDAEVEWGTPATIKVTVYDSEGMPIEGNAVVSVSWIVDGVDQYIDITEGSGEANFEISGFVAPGEYDVTVFYLAGRNYNNASATAKLTLTAPKDINVDVDVDAGDYGEDTNVTVTVTDKANAPVANAPVTVVVDGKEYNAITDENGTVTVPVSGLEAGDHNITVKVDDGVHTPAEETATATVDPASGADIQATVEPGHAGQDSIVNVSAKDPEDNPVKGNAIVIVDGEPYTEVPLDENGTASVPIKDLPTGEHTVEVVFDNPNYLPSSYTTHFDVKAQDTKLVVAVDKESIVYGDGAVTATIGLSADGKPISGVVEVILNGDPQNVTVTNGLATVKFNNLAAANYTVIGNFAGTSVYTGATDSANFNVERKATKFNYENMKTTAVNPNIDGRIGEYFYFQLLDEDGKALANKPVVIGFNGKTYNKTTNETGWARLQINLARAFRYTFAINFAGDENYTSAFNVALINVTTQAPKLTTSSKSYAASAKTKTLTATFKTKSGNAVSGRQITFTVNGKSYSAKTNAKGVATVKVSLSKKGTYSFTAKFAGDDTYSAVSKSAKLTIK